MARDLSIEPIELNATARVTADGLQWLLQKREPNGRWLSVSYCQTRAGLTASVGYEVHGVRGIDPDAWSALERLPEHRRHAPGYMGVDVNAELARARAQDEQHAKLSDAEFFKMCTPRQPAARAA